MRPRTSHPRALAPAPALPAVLPAVLAAALAVAPAPCAAAPASHAVQGAPPPASSRADTTAASGEPALLPAPAGWALVGASGLGALVASDAWVRDLARQLQGPTGDWLSRHARWFGDWHASLPWLVGGSVAYGAVTGGKSGLEKAAAVLAGAAAGSAANEIVNEAVGRSRPIWGRGDLTFDPLSGHTSFPSGHAAYTFAVAGAIDAVTDGWLPAAAAYAVASATALSRVYDDKHWLSDIVVGSALGGLVGRLAAGRVLRALQGGSQPASAGGQGASAPRSGRFATRPDASAPGSPSGLRARPILAPGLVGVSLRF